MIFYICFPLLRLWISRDYQYNLKHEASGKVCELQLHFCGITNAKINSHADYERKRAITRTNGWQDDEDCNAEALSLDKKMKDAYDANAALGAVQCIPPPVEHPAILFEIEEGSML